MDQSEWVRQLRPPANDAPLVPASSRESISAATTTIGADAVGWAVSAAAEVVESVATALSDTPAPVEMTSYEREACEACLLTALIALTHAEPITDLHAPAEAVNQVRMSVRQGIPIDIVVRTVWASHAKVQNALLSEIETLLSHEQVVPAARLLNQRLFEVVNIYVRELMAEYEEELSTRRGDLSEDRIAVFESLLDGSAPPGAERVLGLRLDSWHLVAQAWRSTAGYIREADAEIGRYVAAATRTLGATASLVLPHGSVTTIWWTFRSPPPDVVRALSGPTRPEWLHLSLGEAARGARGVRDAYRSACLSHAAMPISAGRASPVVAYETVRVATLALGEADAAAQFVRSVLRGALSDDQKVRDYREAARAYLATGLSRQAAARQLHVAPNTVAYRVTRLGELLGRAVQDNLVETLIALELTAHAPELLQDARVRGREGAPRSP